MVQALNKFVTADGKHFDTEEDAVQHEENVVNRKKYKQFLLSQGFTKVSGKLVKLLANFEKYQKTSS